MPIPRVPELSREYRDVYWRQWWAMATKRKPQDDFEDGECVGCKKIGLLGYELVHVGIARPTNLFCSACRKKG